MTFKIFSKVVFGIYLLLLIWLVIFKFRSDFLSIFDEYRRSLNLIPFAAPSISNGRINYVEMILNCIIFIPFGVLSSVNFKKIGFFTKLFFILLFSLSAEIIQYVFAIGATDITDLITNFAGGFIGLAFYAICSRFIKNEALDKIVVSLGVFLILLFLFNHFTHIFIRIQ